MKKWKIDNSWTLFLDRDGVINVRLINEYVTSVDQFRFLPRVPETIAALSSYFGYIFVVTNQQGIAKELMTENDLIEIHQHMQQEIEKHGGSITRCYYAPGLASSDNQLRKPKPGMALLAQRQHKQVDFRKSIMVGDTDSDILFGQKLGMKTVRILTEEKAMVKADLDLTNLDELLHFLEV
jgi:histidinol-phosphate phosphatase family protein